MKTNIVHISICLIYYILGAYATTDILRLLKGNTVSVSASDCYCPVCHWKIPLRDQLPVISYLKNHGSCRNCKSPIPVPDLLLEIILFLIPTAVSCILQFSWYSYGFCVLFYECTKVMFIFRYGKRENAFFKNLITSLSVNLLLFSLLAFLFALAHITSGVI